MVVGYIWWDGMGGGGMDGGGIGGSGMGCMGYRNIGETTKQKAACVCLV